MGMLLFTLDPHPLPFRLRVFLCVDRKRNCNPNLYLAPNLNPLTLTLTLTLAS